MTIAAGFPYDGGVLLCCDSLHEAGTVKFNASKLDSHEFPGGEMGFAFAGNTAFAITEIQKIKTALSNVDDPEKVVSEIERIHDRQYRKTVYAHPDRSTDYAIPYWLLLAYHPKNAQTSLYATHDATIRRVGEFVSIGIGRELASYLVKPSYGMYLSEKEVVTLASYMLNRVKDFVPGCGGPSSFLALRDDGGINYLSSPAQSRMDETAENFDRLSQEILFSMIDIEYDDVLLEMKIDAFEEWIESKRKGWRFWQDMIAKHSYLPGGPLDPQSPTGDQSGQLPLPESPGGSGES
jgi:hypothetical protein